jgi:hypothetical protein
VRPAAARQAAEAAKASNVALQEARRAAAKEQQARDEQLMQETIRWVDAARHFGCFGSIFATVTACNCVAASHTECGVRDRASCRRLKITACHRFSNKQMPHFCCCLCLLWLGCSHRTLQRQEEAREAALKAFHDNIARRAAAAGAAVVAENRARQEREERLMAASEAQAEAEAQVRKGKGCKQSWVFLGLKPSS